MERKMSLPGEKQDMGRNEKIGRRKNYPNKKRKKEG
jgi:hypothetical protein